MDPDQLKQEEDLLSSEAQRHHKEAEREKQRIDEIEKALETTRLNGERSIEVLRREAENRPDDANYWNEKIQIEQTQIDQAIQKMEMQLRDKNRQYEKLRAQAEQVQNKVDEVGKKRRQRTALLFLAEDSPNQT